MPINTGKVTSLNLFAIKRAIETLSRRSLDLQNPTGKTDKLYIKSAPGTADLDEGQVVFYVSGSTYRLYTKINGVIKYWALT
jgi:hypothetical protein